MGFSKPKIPKAVAPATNADLIAAQREAAKAASIKLPPIERQGIAPPAQQSAADIAAAERMARQQMAGKKGIAWTQHTNPTLG